MIDIKAFKKAHPVGFLKTPDFSKFPNPILKKAPTGLIYPGVVDNRDMGSKTKDQGALPQCAAYASAAMVEQFLRQRDGIVYDLDTAKIYNRAKELDGDKEDGTTLDHAMLALMEIYKDYGYLPETARIYLIQNLSGYTDELKRFISKYGCCMLGLAITDGWYYADIFSKAWIPSGSVVEGGHAVLAVGYNHNGVIIKNSWGKDWGDFGFAVLSWEDLGKQFIYGLTILNMFDNFG